MTVIINFAITAITAYFCYNCCNYYHYSPKQPTDYHEQIKEKNTVLHGRSTSSKRKVSNNNVKIYKYRTCLKRPGQAIKKSGRHVHFADLLTNHICVFDCFTGR
ncbi:unnamed protein product [Schistosoma intercalatum]|nr:unnamed protein product [Schistosoma intercalatum]